MGRIIQTETRKRGFFGWLFYLLFIAFNALMALWLIRYWIDVSSLKPDSEAGHAIGVTIGTGAIAFFWAAGALILGLFSFLTRGKKVIIQTTED